MLSGDAHRRYIWADLEINTVDIGKSLFRSFEKVAESIRYLKFSVEMQAEWFYYGGVTDVKNFINAKEIWIVPLDGLGCCVGATEEHYWPCGEENVYYIDPENPKRVFRGPDGEGEIDDLCLLKVLQYCDDPSSASLPTSPPTSPSEVSQ